MKPMFQSPLVRAGVLLALLALFVVPAMAQTKDAGGESPKRTGGFRELITDGGTIGFIIILTGTVALGFAVEHALTINGSRLMPEEAIDDLTKMVKERKVDEAIAYCESREHPSLLTNVVLAGLYRYKGSDYGYAEYRAAVEVDMAFLAWEDDFWLAISCQKFSKLTFLVSSLPPFGRNRGLQPLRPESPQLPPRHHDFAVLLNLGGP